MADFEASMVTILAALTWTTCTSQPSTAYGDVNPLNPIAYLRVRNDEEDILEGLTYAGSIAYKKQQGTIEGFAISATSRNNMATDLENGLGGQGVFIHTRVDNTYKNRYSFYMNLERIGS